MAVVLYSGGLSGFFFEAWRSALPEAVGSQAQDEADESLDADDQPEATEDDLTGYFSAFRDQLASELRPHLGADLTWHEGSAAAETVALVQEADFGALMTLAARAAIADKRLKPINRGKPWFEDPAVEALHEEEEHYQVVHHLVQADSWLPADFAFLIPLEVPGRDLILGSQAQLEQALAEMQPLLFQPSELTRKLAKDFVLSACRAHTSFTAMLAHAREHGSVLLIGTH